MVTRCSLLILLPPLARCSGGSWAKSGAVSSGLAVRRVYLSRTARRPRREIRHTAPTCSTSISVSPPPSLSISPAFVCCSSLSTLFLTRLLCLCPLSHPPYSSLLLFVSLCSTEPGLWTSCSSQRTTVRRLAPESAVQSWDRLPYPFSGSVGTGYGIKLARKAHFGHYFVDKVDNAACNGKSTCLSLKMAPFFPKIVSKFGHINVYLPCLLMPYVTTPSSVNKAPALLVNCCLCNNSRDFGAYGALNWVNWVLVCL